MRKTVVLTLLVSFCLLSGFQQPQEETEGKKREADSAERTHTEMGEERPRGAAESGLLAQYKARVRQRIESNWLRPARSKQDLTWVALLDILPGNEVGGISFEQFNGTEADLRSIEAAIRRSSPLPAPPLPELFERQLRLRYPAPIPDVLTTGNVPIVYVVPTYPREALLDGIEGYVNFELLVGVDGRVLDVKVTEAAPDRIFVRNAVRAVRLWKFQPLVVDGVRVERWVKSGVNFELDD